VHQFMRKPTGQKRIDLTPINKWVQKQQVSSLFWVRVLHKGCRWLDVNAQLANLLTPKTNA
jgi:hypothetical protein